MRRGDLAHLPHAHYDQQSASSGRCNSYCPVQVPRRAKERRRHGYSLSDSNRDAETDTDTARRLKKNSPRTRQGRCVYGFTFAPGAEDKAADCHAEEGPAHADENGWT